METANPNQPQRHRDTEEEPFEIVSLRFVFALLCASVTPWLDSV
jgi:hypothetical protein